MQHSFLAGFLGFLTLNLPVKEPLLPLLTGLFGLSGLIVSIKNKTVLPPQTPAKISKINLTKKEILKSMAAASISAPLSVLPGLGSGQAAVIGSEIIPQTPKQFLFLVGSINTIIMALSFVALFSLQKTRTGAAVAISKISEITPQILFYILLTIIISSFLAFFLGIYLSKAFSKSLNKINYQLLSLIIISILIIINLLFSNTLGFVVLLTSSSLGVFAILSKARRINLMGCLLLPTIIFYLSI